MYEVTLLNLETNSKFTKVFTSEYLLTKFKNKCKYSKKVKIVAIFKEAI